MKFTDLVDDCICLIAQYLHVKDYISLCITNTYLYDLLYNRNDTIRIKVPYKYKSKQISGEIIEWLGRHVDILDLSWTKVVDVGALGNVNTLDLSFTKVVDVSALGNVHTLDLWGTNVVDVSALENVHTLNLGNTKVVDVSALGNVVNLCR